MARREFPFRARIGGKVVTITGLHWSGTAYETQGYGLVPLSVQPTEETQEPTGMARGWATWHPTPKQVKLQGCFRDDPLPHYEVKRKAAKAQRWLAKTLTGPMPASQVYEQARKAGIPARGRRRAKKRLKVRSIRVSVPRRWGGWGGVWFWTPEGKDNAPQ